MTAPQPDPTAAHEPAPPTDQPDTAVTGPGPAPLPDLPLRPPQRPDELGRLGPYRVLAVLGQGGMGAVYRAEDPSLRREVALKVMLPKHAASPASRARFLREARAQAAVEHDHVAVIHQVGEDAGVPYLAMPLLRGMSLADALRMNSSPPIGEVVRIGREIADGLAAAHRRGLIHRDIKPGNVWLEGDRLRVKILDFGLARAATDDDDGPLASGIGSSPAHLTHTGGVVGTPAYMSPEQATGDAIDPRADLFSLGVVLYQMATGRRPFVGPTTPDVLAAITTFVPPPASAANPGVPPQLDRFIARLLSKDPAGRPASATAVVEELQQIELALTSVRVVPLDAVPRSGPDPFADLEEPTAADTLAPVRVSRPSVNWKWPAVGAAVFVVAVSWVVFFGRPASPPTTRSDRPATAFVPPPPTKPKAKPKPVMDIDRRAAEALRAAFLVVRTAAGQREVKPGDPLPDEPFEIVRLDYRFSQWDGRDIYPGVYVTDTLLPAVAELKHLTSIGDSYIRLSMTADDLNRLADGPSVANITHLPAVEVSPAGMTAVRRFPAVQVVQVRAESLDDGGLELLADELPPTVNKVHFRNLGACGPVTDRGVAALARRPFSWLTFHSCPCVDPAFVRRLATMPKLALLWLPGTKGMDGIMDEVAKLPALWSFSANGADLTDAGLMRLAASKTVVEVDVYKTKVTAVGIAAFRAARPKVIVTGGPAETPPDGTLVDLLAARTGSLPVGWRLTADGLVSDPDKPTFLPLAARPAGDYEVTATVTAIAAGEAFGLLLPVAGTTVHCLVNGYGPGDVRRAGVRYVPLPGVDPNQTTAVHPAFVAGSRHTLAVEVREVGEVVQLVVRLNNYKMKRWEGRASDLPHPADLDAAGKDRIQVTSYKTAYRVEAVTLRSLPPAGK